MAAIVTYGLTLTVGSAVVSITSVTGPSITRDFHDVTDLLSPHMRFLPKRPDSGELTLELNFNLVDASHAALLATLASALTIVMPTISSCVLTYSNGTGFSFNAWVAEFTPKGTNDDHLTATVRLKIDGAVTLDVTPSA
jgi:hypothetical protein